MFPSEQLKQRHDALSDIGVQILELRGHVRQSGETVGVQILVTHACHVELNGAKNHGDQ